jgi:hypothetical protein
MFAIFLHVLPYALGGALVLYVLYGFWQGLRPRRDSRLPPPSTGRHFWWSID